MRIFDLGFSNSSLSKFQWSYKVHKPRTCTMLTFFNESFRAPMNPFALKKLCPGSSMCPLLKTLSIFIDPMSPGESFKALMSSFDPLWAIYLSPSEHFWDLLYTNFKSCTPLFLTSEMLGLYIKCSWLTYLLETFFFCGGISFFVLW